MLIKGFIQKYHNKRTTALLVGIVVLIIGLILFRTIMTEETNLIEQDIKKTTLETEDIYNDESEMEEKVVYIDVKGEVNRPGVYTMTADARVKDVIKAAGGFTETAETVLINMAQKLADEMVIYVPKIGEDITETKSHYTANENELININQASEEELQKLNGIGPSKAAAIITYREESGPFQKIDEVQEVNGIGEKLFQKIKDSITLN